MKAEVAIIGGSGFETLFRNSKRQCLRTPYGFAPSLFFEKIGNKSVVFLPRHGPDHSIPPHKINYRANVCALHMIGVERIIGTNAVGAINHQFKPMDIVIPHDFIDFTKARRATFHDKAPVTHIDLSYPYCPEIRRLLAGACRKTTLHVWDKAVVACTEGPRLETPTEVEMLRHLGCDVVGMTTYPEVVLARELGMCYGAICYVSNLASGMQERLTTIELLRVSKRILPRMEKLLIDTVEGLPVKSSNNCPCKSAIKDARFE